MPDISRSIADVKLPNHKLYAATFQKVSHIPVNGPQIERVKFD